MDPTTINPAFAEVEFVIYYMQTSFRPTTMIYTAANGVEARQATIQRDLREMQFEDGFFDLPEGAQDGRMIVSFKGTLSIEAVRQIIPQIGRICAELSDEYSDDGPGLHTQLFVAARSCYVLKDEPVTSISAPLISERPVTEEFVQVMGDRLKEGLATYKLKQPHFLSLEAAPSDEEADVHTLTLCFYGEVSQSQFRAIRREFCGLAAQSDNVEVDDDGFCISYGYLGDVIGSSIITAQIFMPPGGKPFLEKIQGTLSAVFPHPARCDYVADGSGKSGAGQPAGERPAPPDSTASVLYPEQI